MEDSVDVVVGQRSRQQIAVDQRAGLLGDVGLDADQGERRRSFAGRPPVEGDDLDAPLEQGPAEPGADESTTAGDERDPHAVSRTAAVSQIRHGGDPAVPEVVEQDRVLVGVHAVPEALVAVPAQLAGGGEPLERLALEDRVLAEVGERPRLEEEEPGVDPLLHRGFSTKPLISSSSPIIATPHCECGPDQRHRRGRAVGAVEVERLAEVDVGDAVGVGERERPLPEAGRRPGDAAAGRACRRRCRGTRPRRRRASVRSGAELGDHLAPVPGQQEEAAEAVRRVDPDHVPDDRHDRRSRPAPSGSRGSAPAAGCRALRRGSRPSRRVQARPCRPAAQPPATAGRIVTSAPSAIVVSSPSWKRMSSPET